MKNSNPQHIRISDYNYPLADERIAKYPLSERDSSKLLVYKTGQIKDLYFKNISDMVPAHSLLIFNNTKVIQARLHFQKSTGAKIEVFCLEPYSPNDYLQNFQQTESCSWICLVGNAKRWKDGKLQKNVCVDDKQVELWAERVEVLGESSIVRFSWNDSTVCFSEILDAIGELPIPPYLHRDTEESDITTYQTVYSKIEGSVAAPTAGLHFTDKVLTELRTAGNSTDEVTLHVGAGTFKPVKAEEIQGHEMHAEFISVRKELIENLRANLGHIIAVGTTSVRTLESLYYLGESLSDTTITASQVLTVGQWQPYADTSNQLTIEESLDNILSYLDRTSQTSILANTQIMIAPSYQFKVVNGIVTNFHQPQSTLLLLVSAFVGEDNWQTIYKHALDNDYRFLSYGDSSLLLK